MTYLLIILAVACWAFTFVGIKDALQAFSPLTIASVRFLVATATLMILAWFDSDIKLSWRKARPFFPLGIVLAGNHLLLNYGIQHITAGETTFLVSTSQLFQILLAAWFLHEWVSLRFVLGMSMSFLGVAIIALVNTHGLSFNYGIPLVLGAALLNAVFFIMQKPLLRENRPNEIIFYALIITTVLLLPFGWAGHQGLMQAEGRLSLILVFVGLATVLAHLSWTRVLATMEASRAAMFLFLVPVATLILGHFWLGEWPTSWSLIGGLCIVTGVFVSNLKYYRHEKDTSSRRHRHAGYARGSETERKIRSSFTGEKSKQGQAPAG